mmetsp:Transcript_7895/g.12632  ORF Transcript_7895/g.12632 Transcript_7895/m.12632 type:complete len:705 (+) Transcript_7895:48-2162(+)
MSKGQNRKSEILYNRDRLPVFSAKQTILDAFAANQVLIIVGETGSGKTTQIPQFLDEAGYSKTGAIGITQPRRVAAITVAQRVAYEKGVKLGEEVGYCIRFEDVSSDRTRIRYMTDGMLLRELLLDSNLKRYSVVLLDEAHERSLHTDCLFALLKGLLSRRPDLKVAVMSATLDAVQFSCYFNNAPVVYVEGRQFDVEVFYVGEAEADFVDAAVITALQLHISEPPGDILIFLTGQEEIESVERVLNQKNRLLSPDALKMEVCPLFAALPWEQQARVFEPAPDDCRKIVLATNIAETSVTINRIKYVIDPGLVKMKTFEHRIGLETLLVTPVSKAAARQRTGRAGRDGPGVCYRLYTEEAFWELPDTTMPEITRCNVASVVLELKALGIEDILAVDFMDAPPSHALRQALAILLQLGALTSDGKLSQPLGRQMASFPLDPMFSKALISSKEQQCLSDMLSIVSLLSVESVFYSPRDKREQADAAKKRFAHVDGDHMTLVNVYGAYIANNKSAAALAEWCREHFINIRSLKKAQDVRSQLERLCHSAGLGSAADMQPLGHARAELGMGTGGSSGSGSGSGHSNSVAIRRCLASAFFANCANRNPDGSYLTVSSRQEVSIHPSSVLFNKRPVCVVYTTLIRTSKQYMRDVSVIDPAWLPDHGSHPTKQSQLKGSPRKAPDRPSPVDKSGIKDETKHARGVIYTMIS